MSQHAVVIVGGGPIGVNPAPESPTTRHAVAAVDGFGLALGRYHPGHRRDTFGENSPSCLGGPRTMKMGTMSMP